MKNYFLPFIFLFISNFSFAQIKVKFTGLSPIFFTPENVWNFQVLNFSQKTYDGVDFEIEVTERNVGNVLSSEIRNQTLEKNLTFFSEEKLKPFSYRFESIEIKEYFYKTGYLPPGDYSICVNIIYRGVSLTEGFQCNQHTVIKFHPPRLIYPTDKATLRVFQPNFTWTPPFPYIDGLEITYEFKLAKIYAGQNEISALLRNPAVLRSENLSERIFPYPSDAVVLEKDQDYAWQVIANISDLFSLSSEVFVFRIKTDTSLENEVTYNSPFVKLEDGTSPGFYHAKEKVKFEFGTHNVRSIKKLTISDLYGNVLLKRKDLRLEKGAGNRYVIDISKEKKLKKENFYFLNIEDYDKKEYHLKFYILK